MKECRVCEVPCEGEYCETCAEWNTLAGGPPAERLEVTARRVDIVATADRLKRNPLDADALRSALDLLEDA